jgi:hypothetical protein
MTAAEREAAYLASLSQKPANVRARERRAKERERSDELRQADWDCRQLDRRQPELWESLADAFDFADPSLWRSNSFASLRPRLVIHLRHVVAKLERELDHDGKRHKPWGGTLEPAHWAKQRVERIMPRLTKAREVLALLETDTCGKHTRPSS